MWNRKKSDQQRREWIRQTHLYKLLEKVWMKGITFDIVLKAKGGEEVKYQMSENRAAILASCKARLRAHSSAM